MNNSIAVFGSAQITADSIEYETARKVGAVLAQQGLEIICGGFGGVMEAICRGASENAGYTRGVGLSYFTMQPNPYLNQYSSVDKLGERLDYFYDNCDLILGMPGGVGTLTEVMYFWDLAKAQGGQKKTILLYGKNLTTLLETLRDNFIINKKDFNHIKIITTLDDLKESLAL